MAVLYELLAGGGEPRGRDRGRARAARPRRRSESRRDVAALRPISALDWRGSDGEPADALVIRGARVLDPLDGARRGPRRRRPRRARSPSSPQPGSGEADGRRGDRGRRPAPLFPAFFDPHVHLRTPGREDKEDVETGSRAAAAGGFCGIVAMANTDPPIDTAADVAALREQAREQAAVPVGFVATVTKGMAGAELSEMSDLAAAGAVGLLRRRAADPQRPGDAPGAPVPAARRPADRAARGGPRALGRRLDARGRGLGRARDRRRPLGLGVDDDRPRLRPRRVRGGADPRPAPLGGRVGGGDRAGEGRRGSRSPARRRRTT